jgi:hypothetical protein
MIKRIMMNTTPGNGAAKKNHRTEKMRKMSFGKRFMRPSSILPSFLY